MRQPKFRMRQPNAPTELAKSKPGVPGAGLELQARSDTSTFEDQPLRQPSAFSFWRPGTHGPG